MNPATAPLPADVERGGNGQVDTIEVVQARHAQQGEQVRPHLVGGLLPDERRRRALRCPRQDGGAGLPGRGGQRGGHRAFPSEQVEIGLGQRAQRRRLHLHELLAYRPRAAFRRVPERLELGGDGAAAGHVPISAEGLQPELRGAPHEAVPFDARVAIRKVLVEKPLALDEAERAPRDLGNRVERRVDLARCRRRVERPAVPVEQGEASLQLLPVQGKDAPVHEPGEAGRHLGLPLDFEPAGLRASRSRPAASGTRGARRSARSWGTASARQVRRRRHTRRPGPRA